MRLANHFHLLPVCLHGLYRDNLTFISFYSNTVLTLHFTFYFKFALTVSDVLCLIGLDNLIG